MRLPSMEELNKTRGVVDAFAGYNHNIRIGEGEFYDMKNLSSTLYPILSPRTKRGVYASPEAPLGMISKDALGYIEGGEFILNKNSTVGLGLDITGKAVIEKTILVSMGAYVIIITRDSNGNAIDKKWVNTLDLTEYGNIESELSPETNVGFAPCMADGSALNTVAQDFAPTITEEMESGEEEIPMWVDTSTVPHSLKQYSTSMATWTQVATSYVKITADRIDEYFNVGDGVTIKGIKIEYLTDLNNTSVILDKGENYIVVIGICDTATSQAYEDEEGNKHPITFSRKMPEVDFLIESENRLWGCRYGVASNGEVVNELYACKLGDFKNWYCFQGISTDSYAVSLGTDGVFTGAITYLGYPIFFKENYLHKVYGNFPANYQIATTACRGVQKGSDRSLAMVNETLLYKGRNGICGYDGSLPSEISYSLGNVPYTDAVAGANGNKYYISMKDADGTYHFFVYDTSTGLWHKEDNTQVDAFCSCRGEMYFIDHADKKIKTVLNSAGSVEKDIPWMCETGIIGTDSPDFKYISKLNIRMSLAINAKVFVYVQYDSQGDWKQLFTMSGTSLRSFTIPIQPQRCDHLRLRIEGVGEAKIFSIAKTIEDGSDWR